MLTRPSDNPFRTRSGWHRRRHQPAETCGAQPQSRHRIQLAVPRGQKNDRQFRGQCAQIAAQIEAAFSLVLERNIDDGKIGQARAEGLHGRAAIAVGLDRIAVASQGRGVIFAQCRLVLDDRNLFFHG